MKKILLHILCCMALSLSFAQSIPPPSISDSVIGWMKIYHFKGALQPVKVDSKTYSVAQLSICDSFVNWMQASYFPRGGLGDIKKRITGKLGPYNQNDAALPQSYGAVAKIYMFLRYNDKKKMVPENNLGLSWSIMANGIPGWEVRDISSPAQYYFTMPSFDNEPEGEKIKKVHDLTTISKLKRYTSFWVKNIETGNGTDYVLLSKDNRFPFIRLTKGEYLQALEEAIPGVYQQEKKQIYEREQGNLKTIAVFMKILDEKTDKRRAGLQKIKAKYKDRLEEIALTSAQPSLTDLENDRDVFSNGYLSDAESTSGRMPVYRIDPQMAELCKKDKPQWILMDWFWSPNQPVEKHLHESILNNFDFDYVYDFFFDTAKLKARLNGQDSRWRQYQPLRSPLYKDEVVVMEESKAGRKNKTDKDVFFFDDFSSTAIGKKPNGWKSKLNYDGQYCLVTTVEGEPGNWTEIKGNEAFTPVQLSKPLPQNFTISYDVVAPQNFTWGGKALAFQLSKETAPGNAESYMILKLRPGYDGRDGEAEIETKFTSPPGYLTGTKWMKAPGFSNNKRNNRIKVIIKKKEEGLLVFIDDHKIAEYEKAIPAALLFNAFSFTHGRSDGDTEKYYISNIRITID